jgi:hypothetical protein
MILMRLLVLLHLCGARYWLIRLREHVLDWLLVPSYLRSALTVRNVIFRRLGGLVRLLQMLVYSNCSNSWQEMVLIQCFNY